MKKQSAAEPTEAELNEAAAVLNAGTKVAILIGAGASGAEDEVIAAAELLGAGVAKALLGRAVREYGIARCRVGLLEIGAHSLHAQTSEIPGW